MGCGPHPDPPSARHPKINIQKGEVIHLRKCPLNQAHPESGVQRLPSAFTVHRSPAHRSPFTVHRSPFTVHRSPFTVHRSPFTVHRSAFGVRRSRRVQRAFRHHSNTPILQPRRTPNGDALPPGADRTRLRDVASHRRTRLRAPQGRQVSGVQPRYREFRSGERDQDRGLGSPGASECRDQQSNCGANPQERIGTSVRGDSWGHID